MTAVYITSPYTIGDVAQNVRRQIDAYNELFNAGFLPFAPLLSHFIHMVHPLDYEDWMLIDYNWIERCDCLLVLPGESKGSNREIRFAESIGKPVFYSVAEIRAYFIIN